MATCKDCIHSGICAIQLEPHYVLDRTQKLMRESNNVEHECLSFKDRSRFVELPCKINQKLYTHDGECVLEAIVIGVDIIQMSKEKVKEIRLRIPQIGKYFMVRRPFSDIGKKYFFTREEAEQALKEREENA